MSLAKAEDRKKRRRRGSTSKSPAAEPRRSASEPSFISKLTSRLFAEEQVSFSDIRVKLLLGGSLFLAIFTWAYWPTLVEMVETWEREPDYSHGYLILPIALYFLWANRQWFPGFGSGVIWAGLALIGVSIGIRYLASLWFLGSVDGWSMLPCIAGMVWILCGTRVLWWSLPSIGFLLFMVPMPYRAERMMSLPLQGIATKLSTWTLQLLGQPAFAEGHTIILGDHPPLEVAEACSGLRIFMGIIALAFAYVVLTRRTWWEKVLLIAAVLPIALVANATRIVVTGLLYQWVSGDAAHKFSHDLAGYVMIPYAALLFALCLWYLSLLYREEETMDAASLARRPTS